MIGFGAQVDLLLSKEMLEDRRFYLLNALMIIFVIISSTVTFDNFMVMSPYNYIQVGALCHGRGKSDVLVTSSRSEKLVNI